MLRYELSSLTAKSLGYPGQSLYLTNRPGDLVNLHHLFQLSRKLVLEGTVFKQQVQKIFFVSSRLNVQQKNRSNFYRQPFSEEYLIIASYYIQLSADIEMKK